jgi:hypothetical protein
LTVVALALVACGGTSIAKTDPSSLASEIGASSCSDSGFYIESKLDHSKAEVYDCQRASGGHQCVTKEGGLAHDVTVEFKLLMQQTITDESSKPVCALGEP